jgi:hypothetical protein
VRPIRIEHRYLLHSKIQTIVECLRAVRDINLEIAHVDAERDAENIQALLDEIRLEK